MKSMRYIALLLFLPVSLLAQTAEEDSLFLAIEKERALRDSAQNVQDAERSVELTVSDDSTVTLRGEAVRVTDEDMTSGVVVSEAPGMTKSPWGAVLRSAIIPGWGQLYNESYLKVPVVAGLAGFLIWGVVNENRSFQQYADLYDDSISEENPNGDLEYKQYREYYRYRRDTYALWGIIVYFLQLADAFVDAHLFDFDVSDEVSAFITPTPGGLGMQLRF